MNNDKLCTFIQDNQSTFSRWEASDVQTEWFELEQISSNCPHWAHHFTVY